MFVFLFDKLQILATELRDVPEDATDEDKLIALFKKLQVANSENSSISSKLKQADKRLLSVRST